MSGVTRLFTLCIPPERCGGLSVIPLGILVTSLFRELILELVRLGDVLTADRPHRSIVEAMLITLERAESLPLTLSLPLDLRAQLVARAILVDPTSERMVDVLTAESGGKLRTIQRRFVNETGMSISEWRQVARLMTAAALLLDGRSVNNAALGAGYSGFSAFSRAFRLKFGQTPSDFRAGAFANRDTKSTIGGHAARRIA